MPGGQERKRLKVSREKMKEMGVFPILHNVQAQQLGTTPQPMRQVQPRKNPSSAVRSCGRFSFKTPCTPQATTTFPREKATTSDEVSTHWEPELLTFSSKGTREGPAAASRRRKNEDETRRQGNRPVAKVEGTPQTTSPQPGPRPKTKQPDRGRQRKQTRKDPQG